MRFRPHSLEPRPDTVRAVIAYKNFAAHAGISHIGLGVAAMHASQVLRQHGLWVDVWPIISAADLDERLRAADAAAVRRGELPISHVIVSAPWISTPDWARLIIAYPQTHFAVVSHSNVAFLHADPNGMRLLREAMGLQAQWHNFSIAANFEKFVSWVHRAYGVEATPLPNLYNLEGTAGVPTRPAFSGGTLRIGSFGATRILKNHVTACASALEIGRRLGVDTEFWLSGGRREGGESALATIAAMSAGIRGFTVQSNHWQSWTEFRASIRSMHLLLQPSFTESFNMVTADGAAEGVPSVVSEAIEWVPEHWQACADDALKIANRGIALLHDPHAGIDGRNALARHNERGVAHWKTFLLHGDRHGRPWGGCRENQC